MRLLISLSAAGFLGLAGCTQFPALEGRVGPEVAEAPYPDLVPLEQVFAQVDPTTVDPEREEAGLEGRLGRLRARADRLRGSVIGSEDRRRLEAGLR